MSIVGTIAIIAGVVALLALVALFVTGYHAVRNEGRMTSTEEGKHVAAAFLYVLVCSVATLVFIVAGIVWIVQQFTT